MPQMSPINWLILMIFFIMILFIYNMLNYFIYLPNICNSLKNFKYKKFSMDWKW